MNDRKDYIEENLTEILKDLKVMSYEEFTRKYSKHNGQTLFARWIKQHEWRKCIINAIKITLADYDNYKSELIDNGVSISTMYTYSLGKVVQTNRTLQKIENILNIKLEKLNI